MITQSELKEILFYDEVTGYFARYLKSIGVWRVVGVKDADYLQICINHKLYLAHRLAWLYVHGVWPENQIDHIDHNPKNNKIENLREATPQGNQKNRSMNKNNTSGATGVYLDKVSSKLYVQIMINGKNKCLGRFDNLEDAIIARKNAEIKYNFHPNHGR